MQVLIVTWNFPPRRGGIETVVEHVYAGLKKHQPTVVVTSHPGRRVPVQEGVFRAPWPGLVSFASYALWRGSRLLSENPGIDVILGGSAMVAPIVVLLARLFNRRAVLQAHGLDLLYPSFWYQWLCVRWARRCDRLIANSSYTADLAKRKGVRPDRISVIPPGVDVERFGAEMDREDIVKKELGLSGRRVLLFVGRLARRKGIAEFIRYALPRIVCDAPETCLVVVGGNPGESLTHRDDVWSDINRSVKATGLENHVRLLGTVEDEEVDRLFRACDLVILPAISMNGDAEGFGIVLLEAAAAGKPAIATRVGGIPDAVADGETGLLVDPGRYEALSAAVLDLLRDPSRRSVMGERARNRARAMFSWERVICEYQKALET
ncbi:MAG TPA: glycosyltransferase family 4 protein [candidate division Zixibacteria bacterium]|nr:glycosyltransferase family 4 protein [candidate division Zixibacteria bacterium]